MQRQNIYLLAKNTPVTDFRFDERTGQMVEHTTNPKEVLEEMDIKCLPMAEDIVVEKKRGSPVYLVELVNYALVRLKNGKILNSRNGQHLDRIQFLTLEDITQLHSLFSGKGGK